MVRRADNRAVGRRRLVIAMPVPGATGRFLRSGKLCCPERAIGKLTFDAWLARDHSPGARPRSTAPNHTN